MRAGPGIESAGPPPRPRARTAGGATSCSSWPTSWPVPAGGRRAGGGSLLTIWGMASRGSQSRTKPDYFISYTGADRAWAEWIAWTLEAARLTTVLQAWDFRPGSSFALEMDSAA